MLQLFVGRSEQNGVVLEDQVCVDLGQVLVERLKAELVLVLKRLVELEVEMREPPLAEFRLSLLSHRLVDDPHLAEVVTPDNLVPQKVDVHQLNDHVNKSDVHLSELSVFVNELSGTCLHFLNVCLNFSWVVPGDHSVRRSSLTFGVLDDVFELLGFVNHHRHLTLNDLGAHGVVEVGHLLEGDTFFVEFLGVRSHSENLSGDVEAMLS